jgi:hypothetical protein
MIWAGDGALVPLLEPAAVIILAAVLLIGAFVIARRAHISR